jgi:hypothetical protein
VLPAAVDTSPFSSFPAASVISDPEVTAVVNRHGAVVVGEEVHLEHTRSDGERRRIDRGEPR